ncbi:MAG: metallophosphoesterase, partial [Verrucomicrobia bacterium]|nr:metallophosphoesterase [Verrucomicrobiota bacterium]
MLAPKINIEEKTTRRTFVGWLLGLFPLNYLVRLFSSMSPRNVWETASVLKADTLFSADDRALKFLVIGDWGRQGQIDQIGVARQLLKTTQKRKCNFVISVGDNFYENGVQTPEDPQWQTSFENVYGDLRLPWYAILGNHDYRGKPDAQLQYAINHPNWRMPARYYCLTQTLKYDSVAQFFFIDT